MSSSTWREHFKHKLEGWEAPLDGSPLENALIEGRFTEDEYLEWAQKTHFWPLLQGGFFTAHSPQPKLLSRPSAPWSRSLIPVAEWDGLLIMAGLEAPSPLPENCCFVLARIEDMTPWWERLRDESANAPEGASLEGEQPDGIMLGQQNAPAPSLSFANLSLQKTEATPAEMASPTIKQEVEQAVEPESFSTSTEIRVNEQGQHVEVTSISFAATESLAPATPALEDQTRTHIQAEEPPAPAAPVKIAPATSLMNDRHLLAPISKRPGYQDQVMNLLTQMGSYFSKSMILALSDSGDSFIPNLWTEQFQSPDQPAMVPLQDASIFAIVANTEKPYHGLVVPNPVNDAFFAQWNAAETPAHVTIAPIFFQGRMVGAVMGFAQDAQELNTLRSVERFSLDFTKKIGGYVEESAA